MRVARSPQEVRHGEWLRKSEKHPPRLLPLLRAVWPGGLCHFSSCSQAISGILMLLARRDGSGAVYYYLGDHLGSSRVMTDSQGAVVQESDYYPFGGERVVSGGLSEKFKFAGMERDAESGLDHTLFRQYAWNLGRWLSPDPDGGAVFNPQSLNRYGYVLNSPTNLIDPLGLKCAYAREGYIYDDGTFPPCGQLGDPYSINITGSAPPIHISSGPSVMGTQGGGTNCTLYDFGGGLVELICDGRIRTTSGSGYVGGSRSGYVGGGGTRAPAQPQAPPTTSTTETTETVDDVPLSPEAVEVLGTAGSIAGTVASPWAPVAWYGASAAAAVFPMCGWTAAQASWVFLATHPAVSGCAADFVQGYFFPPSGTTSWCGAAGTTLSLWSSEH